MDTFNLNNFSPAVNSSEKIFFSHAHAVKKNEISEKHNLILTVKRQSTDRELTN